MSNHSDSINLFDDFKPVGTTEWKEKMSNDLKGLTFEKLSWKTNEGIEIKPFYTSEDLETLGYLDGNPGEYPFLRGNHKYSNNWEIRQDILVDTVESANATALNALNRGATSLAFIFPQDKKLAGSEFSRLLKDIYIECISIIFISDTQSRQIFGFLTEEVNSRKIDPQRITGSVGADPLGFLTKTGRITNSFEKDYADAASLVKDADSRLPNLRTLAISGQLFHNAGATIVQELGFSLAMISDTLDLLSGQGLKPETIAKNIEINLSVGPVYFMEIAKLRAIRLLFARLCKSWGISDDRFLKTFIHCSTSGWNQSVFDPYVNMLRSSTEGMSAAMGGCDSLTVIPFDNAIRNSAEFSERIARNTQVILKEEAWLDKVRDPAAGSYFIENLTDSLINESWKLFLEIEEMGGYLAAFKNGEIQKRIRNSANLRNQNIAMRKEILLGTNQYANPLESIPEDLSIEMAFPPFERQAGQIAEPLDFYRGAHAFEKLRLKSEGNRQKVFLLTIGNPVWRKARAGFSVNFFSCAGFEVIDNSGFDSLDSGLAKAKSSRAPIVVLCSSDEEYATLAPETRKKLDKHTIIVVAGYPKDCIEDLKSKGIENFIHLKSNVLDELTKYQEMLGM
jgi:methylmalonyl-CoA mutase